MNKTADIKEKNTPGSLIDGDFIRNPEHESGKNPFLWSLENLTPDQIAAPVPPKKKSVTDYVIDIARNLLLLICLGVFAYSAYAIVQQLIDYRRAELLYTEAADMMGEFDPQNFDPAAFENPDAAYQSSPALRKSAVMPRFDNTKIAAIASEELGEALSNVTVSGYNARLEKMKSKLNAMALKNPDTFGWIIVGGTQISYPIMQSTDNDYYLKRAYNGEYLPAGSIFADYRNYKSIMKNFNTVIYGHNMLDGLMFNGIVYFMDEEFFRNNKYIDVYTSEGIYTYEVFSIYKARYDEGYIRTEFENYDQFIEFEQLCNSKSLFQREGIEFKEGDRMLTLSTCTNGPWYYRYALHAQLINVQT
ncbi:MAG: class B sortase [Clostridiales bacterium]|nr:class B sortase [Clostridiales bacterium]